MEQWYVVQTKTREDRLASTMLEGKGVRVYQPQMQRYIFHARRKILKKYPLFPGYIFVCMKATEETLYSVKWCRGVTRVLPDNAQPVPIDETFVAQLMELEKQGEGVIRKPVEFKSGDIVKIKSGPMKDVYGVFESWESDEGRVRILVEMVNNKARLMTHSSLLEKA